MDRNVTIDFAGMDDKDLARFGLDAATAEFARLLKAGALNGDSMFLRVGVVSPGDMLNGDFTVLGEMEFGSDARQFEANTDPETGKLATVIRSEIDSVDAYQMYGEHLGEGARCDTGGVFYLAQVQLGENWRERKFAGAADGVQGEFDGHITSVALRAMGAAWCQRERLRFFTAKAV